MQVLMPRRKLTRTQLGYLDAIQWQGRLRRGWGGYSSTLTVRILEERGLVTLQRLPQLGKADSWEAQITPAGSELLEARRASESRRVNRDPLRRVMKSAKRSGMFGMGMQGLKSSWYELDLECGHAVERSMRYVNLHGAAPQGWARHHGGRSTEEELPAPRSVRCERCGVRAGG